MKRKTESTDDRDQHRTQLLADQVVMLQYVRLWLKYRGMTQRSAAAELGVTEASFSKWIGGTDAMKVGVLRQLATLLRAKPGDLIAPPPTNEVATAVEELLDAAEGLDPEQLHVLTETARLLRRKSA